MKTVTSARREQLTLAALALLEESGPEAMTTRKVAARFGSSTMAVYSEFGSYGGLVASVVGRGFGWLADVLRTVVMSDDPVADIAALGGAYRQFALDHPHLYRVLYAVTPAGAHQRTGAELLQGQEAFGVFLDAVRRAYAAGRLTRSRPYDAALQLWVGLHGIVVLELAGYPVEMAAPSEPLLEGFLRSMLIGFGGDPG